MPAMTMQVPGEVVALLRESLLVQLARACEDAPGSKYEETHAGWAPILARLDGARAALDVIGWDAPEQQQPVALVLDAAMREALHADLDGWRWTAQAEHLESVEGCEQAARKAELIERFLAGAPEPASVTVPAVLVGCIAEGAEDLTHTIAEAIDNGRDLRECAKQLTVVADLLDALDAEGAGAGVELDMAEHAGALRDAVAVMVPVLARAVADTRQDDPAKREREDELRLLRQLAVQVARAMGSGA